MENQTPIAELPKNNNFLVILLSILLFTSIAIAGFFAFQTQKLVKELTLLRSEPAPVVTVEPTTEPVATDGATPSIIANTKSKTYLNTNYGFSFQYPFETKVMGDLNGTTFTLINNDKVVTVIIGDNSQKNSNQDFFLKQISPQDPQGLQKYITFIEVKYGKNNFLWAAQDPNYFKQQPTGLDNFLISTKNNYVINFNTKNSTSLKPEDSLINEILSTFKLTN